MGWRDAGAALNREAQAEGRQDVPRAQEPAGRGWSLLPVAALPGAGLPEHRGRAEDQPGDTPPPSGGRRGCPPPQKPAGLPGAGVRAKRAAENESAVQKKPETPSPMSVEIHATRGGRGGGQHSELLGREGGPRLLRTGRAHRQR